MSTQMADELRKVEAMDPWLQGYSAPDLIDRRGPFHSDRVADGGILSIIDGFLNMVDGLFSIVGDAD